jgi:hypothetical protein
LPAVGSLPHSSLDPQQIRRAVLDAATTKNAELGTAFFPSAIRYVADDTPLYSLYGHCTDLLIRRLTPGEPFTPAIDIA